LLVAAAEIILPLLFSLEIIFVVFADVVAVLVFAGKGGLLLLLLGLVFFVLEFEIAIILLAS
jgi:hypothetical protein